MAEGKHILLVEDESYIRSLWERNFQRWGYDFDSVASGQEGLELARAQSYRILLTDLSLPDLSGQELIHILWEEQPELEIVVVTGNATVETAVEIMKAGAYEFLTKPINFVQAGLVLKNCLEQMDSHQETLRLKRLTEDLETLNDRKEKFIAITNHELRTPVSVIQNVAEMLADEITEGESLHLITMLSRASAQLTEIVSQMHEISHARSDRLSLDKSGFPLKAACLEIANELEVVLRKRRQRLTIEMDEKLFINADRVKLKKVLRELVQNAIKYTGENGAVRINAEVVAGKVSEEPTNRAGTGEVIISVSDTGIGIAEKYQERIFELFYEIGDSLNHASKDGFLGGGMGIGLAIVKEIVTAHNGRVEISSKPGHGSAFSVILPHTSLTGS